MEVLLITALCNLEWERQGDTDARPKEEGREEKKQKES